MKSETLAVLDELDSKLNQVRLAVVGVERQHVEATPDDFAALRDLLAEAGGLVEAARDLLTDADLAGGAR